MFPILYSAITEGVVPSDYGIGVLKPLSCSITEARNGEYELEMEYSAYELHAEDIVPGSYIKAKPNYTDAPQLFQVYKVGKTIDGKFTVNAQHASYLLSGKVITSGTAGSARAACLLLEGASGGFTIATDKNLSAQFRVSEPSSVRSWFGGKEGSILDVYGPGEWYYDNFDCQFLTNRGEDRGVSIRYGKNLTQLSQTLDMSNLASGVIPYYKDNDGNVTTGAEVPTGLAGIQRTIAVNFSSDVDPESGTPITTQLSTLANAYIADNNLTNIKNNITLDFVQLAGLSERIDLCDTVHIFFEPLNLTVTAKCVETVWDVLEERYTSTTFGDPRTNIADTIVKVQKDIDEKPTTSTMNEAVEHATNKISGNLGGYVIIHDSNGDGEPDEILILDTPDINTAVKVWRWNQGGLGFSDSGYAGPFDTLALTNDGQIVATAITTGVLNANLIKAGVISDVAGNSTIDMTNGAAKMKDFDAVNRFRLITSNDVIKAYIAHNSGAGTTLMLQNEDGEESAALQSTNDGGALHLKNKDGLDVVEAYTDSDTGGAYVVLSDVAGVNDCHVQLLDNKRYADVDAMVTRNGGRIDVNNGGYIYGSLRVYNSGGVLDLYDANYLNIQCLGRTGNITCVSLTQTSSRKVKENIEPMTTEEARRILELQAVKFDYKNKNRGTDKRGFIAEDVAEIVPNLVSPETEETAASLDYIGMIPYLQAVIKDQEERIKRLEIKLERLEGGSNAK